MESAVYIILALLGLGFIVFIHELGHYFTAKKAGMKIEVFSIGFGKSFFSWKRNGVKWQICILPFGGYVKIAGMEKQGNLEPYEIKDGFFSKKPLARIRVLLAGPLANIVFAFLVFLFIFFMGGRNKPFAEFTKKIGSIDSKSELYQDGVRSGDEIIGVNGISYNGFKDLIYASVLKDEKLKIKGFKVDYYNNAKNDFEYDVKKYKFPNSIDSSFLTVGIEAPASYLIYTKLNNYPNPLIKDSNLTNGDRIIWANGEALFSVKHLSSIVNNPMAFITVKRGGSYFQVIVPKIKLEDVKLSKKDENEIDDWRHESGIKNKIKELSFLPVFFNEKAVIENKFAFIDEQLAKEIFALDKRNPFSFQLLKGDKIVAVDGIKVKSAFEVLKILQEKHVLMVIERKQSNIFSWNEADREFDKVYKDNNLLSLIQAIGTPFEKKSSGSLILLKPMTPVSFEMLTGEKENFLATEKQILKIEDPEKRAAALKMLDESKKELRLGIALSDKVVKYNPNPFALFSSTIVDMGRNLFSLITGQLSPKWMSGPVGIIQVIQHSWSLGFSEALFWLGLISLNLGILNLLPIPALDGGYIMLSIYEMITRKPIKSKTLERLIVPFVILIILLIVFFTYNDIMRILKGIFQW